MAKEKGVNPTPSKTIGIVDFKTFLDKNSKTNLRQANVTYLKCCKRLIGEAKSLDIFASQKELVVLLILNNLCSPVAEVRNVTNELFTIINPFLNTMKETLTSVLSEPLCELTKNMVELCKTGHCNHVFKVWITIINTLDTSIHRNRNLLNSLLVVLEKTFKIPIPEVQTTSYKTWEGLIDNFALDKNLLVSAKRIKLLMQPLTSSKNFTEETNLARFDAWWHLAYRMEEKLHAEFSTVCLPLLNRTINVPSGPPTRQSLNSSTASSSSRSASGLGDPARFVKVQLKGCEILNRILELPITSSVGLASPKKVPHNSTKSLMEPIPTAVFLRHSNELLKHCKTALDIYNDNKQPQSTIYLLHLVLERMSSLSKESKANEDAVTNFLHFFQNILKERYLEPVNSLKLIDEICRSLPSGLLSSHTLRPPSDSPEPVTMVPAFAFLKFMLNKEFFHQILTTSTYTSTFSKIVIAGAEDNASFLKYFNLVFELLENLFKLEQKITLSQAEVLCKFWLKSCDVLIERVEMTQEVNMGDNLEHNFSTMILALTMPSKILLLQPSLEIAPESKEHKCWEKVCKALFHYSAKMDSIEPNTCCEELCFKILEILEVSLVPCLNFWILQSNCMKILIESIDFQVLNVASGALNRLPMSWKKKNFQTLGTLHSFCTLLDKVLLSCLTLEDNSNKRKKANSKALAAHQVTCLNLVENFFTYIHNLEILLNLIEYLSPTLIILLNHTTKKSGTDQFSQNVEVMWQALVEKFRLRCQSHGVCGQKHFDVLAPLLEVTLQHPLKEISERARRLWNSVFSQIRSELKLTNSFKKVLAKAIPSLVFAIDVSSAEDANSDIFNSEPEQDILESSGTFTHSAKLGTSYIKSMVEEKETLDGKKKTSNKDIFKVPLDELNDDDFVKINSGKKGTPKSLTAHQKEVLKSRSFVPAMYNDLSQNTLNDSLDVFPQNEESSPVESVTIVENPAKKFPSEVLNASLNKEDSQDSVDERAEMSNLVNNIIQNLDQSQDENQDTDLDQTKKCKSLDTTQEISLVVDKSGTVTVKDIQGERNVKTKPNESGLKIVIEPKSLIKLDEMDDGKLLEVEEDSNREAKSNQSDKVMEVDLTEQSSNAAISQEPFKFNVFEVPETMNFNRNNDLVTDTIMEFNSKSDAVTSAMDVSVTTVSYPYKEGGVFETESVTVTANSKSKRKMTDTKTSNRDAKKTRKGSVVSVSSLVSSKVQKNSIVAAMDRLKNPMGSKKLKVVVPKLGEKITASLIPIEKKMPSKGVVNASISEISESIQPTSSELLALITTSSILDSSVVPSSQGFSVSNKHEPIVIDIASSENLLPSTIDISSDSCSSQNQKTQVIKRKGKRKRIPSSSSTQEVPDKKGKLDQLAQEVPSETTLATVEVCRVTKSDHDVENSKENKNPELDLKDNKVVDKEVENLSTTPDSNEVPKLPNTQKEKPEDSSNDPLLGAVSTESVELDAKMEKHETSLSKSFSVTAPPRNTRLQRRNTMLAQRTKANSPKIPDKKNQGSSLVNSSSDAKPDSWSIDKDVIPDTQLDEKNVKLFPEEIVEKLDVDKTNKPVETSNDAMIPVITSSDSIIPVKTSNDANIPAEMSNDANLLVETSDDVIIPSKTSDDANIPAKTSDDANIPAKTSDDANIPMESSDEANIPAGSSHDANIPAGSSHDVNIPAGSSHDVNIPAGSSHDANIPPGLSHDANIPAGLSHDANIPAGLSHDANILAGSSHDTIITAETSADAIIPADMTIDALTPAEMTNVAIIPKETIDEISKTRAAISEASKMTEAPSEASKTTEAPSESSKTTEAPSEASKTTEAPSEASKTTEAPSEASKTTEAPSEASKTTEAPSEASKTTEAPSEASKTTEAPSEASKTTEAPSEASKTTEAPSEASKTTEAPSEASKTTEAPSEASKTTEAPSEASKTTEAPSEASKTTEAPSEASKTTEAPSEASKTTEAPSEASKTTEAPSEASKTTEAPSEASKTTEAPSEASKTMEAPSEASKTTEAPSEASQTTEAPSEASKTTETPCETSKTIPTPVEIFKTTDNPDECMSSKTSTPVVNVSDTEFKKDIPNGAEENMGEVLNPNTSNNSKGSDELQNIITEPVSTKSTLVGIPNHSPTSVSNEKKVSNDLFTKAIHSRLSFGSSDMSSTKSVSTSDELYTTAMQSLTIDNWSTVTMDKLDNVFVEPQEATDPQSPPALTPQFKKHKQIILGSSPLSRSQRILQAAINNNNSVTPTRDGTVKRVESSKDSPKSSKSSASTIDSPTTGILKSKRNKLSDEKAEKSPSPTNKQRRVSFADPLTEQFLVESQKKSSRRLKLVGMEIDESREALTPLTDPDIESDSQMTGEITTSPEECFELDSQEPIYSQLFHCKEKVQLILNSLTTTLWVKSLEVLLKSKNIRSIGDLSRLTPLDVKSLPFKEPKVAILISVLTKHFETCLCTNTTSTINDTEEPELIELAIEGREENAVQDSPQKSNDEEVKKIIEKYLTPDKTNGVECFGPKNTPLELSEIEVIQDKPRSQELNSDDFINEVVKRMETMSQSEIINLWYMVGDKARKLINKHD